MTDSDILAEVGALVESGLRLGSAIRAVSHANMISAADVQEIVNRAIEYSVPAKLALGVQFA